MEWFFWILAIGFGITIFLVCAYKRDERERQNERLDIVCINANCGYKGKPYFERQRSVLVFWFLFLCGIWPAILYYVIVKEFKYSCPQCKMKLEF